MKLLGKEDQYICTNIDTVNNVCALNKQTLDGEYISSESEHIPDLKGWLDRTNGDNSMKVFDQITGYCFTDMITNPVHDNKYVGYEIV